MVLRLPCSVTTEALLEDNVLFLVFLPSSSLPEWSLVPYPNMFPEDLPAPDYQTVWLPKYKQLNLRWETLLHTNCHVWLILISGRYSMQQGRIQRRDIWPASWRAVRGLPEEEEKSLVGEGSNPISDVPLPLFPQEEHVTLLPRSHGPVGRSPPSQLLGCSPGLSRPAFKTPLRCHHLKECVLTPHVRRTTPLRECVYGCHHYTVLRVIIICFNSVSLISNEPFWGKNILIFNDF